MRNPSKSKPVSTMAGSIVLAVSLAGLVSTPCFGDRWEIDEKRTIEESLRLPASSSPRLVVDNIDGEIRVVGHDGDAVRLVARERLQARDAATAARARAEAGLEIRDDGSTLTLIVDGPFRRPDGGVDMKTRELGYNYAYDFDLEVPRRVDILLKTVNGGDISVRNLEGQFEVRNVNGAITMAGIDGYGAARTVNGGIEVDFVRSPEGECAFKTVNGSIEIEVPEGFSADARFQTMNGSAFSDFPYTSVPTEVRAERRGDRRAWKKIGSTARIAGGGPDMSFETLNGSIYIRKGGR